MPGNPLAPRFGLQPLCTCSVQIPQPMQKFLATSLVEHGFQRFFAARVEIRFGKHWMRKRSQEKTSPAHENRQIATRLDFRDPRSSIL